MTGEPRILKPFLPDFRLRTALRDLVGDDGCFPTKRRWRRRFCSLLTLAVFGGVLFGPADVVLSNVDADLQKQFVHWRSFGFGELRAGAPRAVEPAHLLGRAVFRGIPEPRCFTRRTGLYPLPAAGAGGQRRHRVARFPGGMVHVVLDAPPRRCIRWRACWRGCCSCSAGRTTRTHLRGPPAEPLHDGLATVALFLAIDGWLERRTPGWSCCWERRSWPCRFSRAIRSTCFIPPWRRRCTALLHLPGTARRCTGGGRVGR